MINPVDQMVMAHKLTFTYDLPQSMHFPVWIAYEREASHEVCRNTLTSFVTGKCDIAGHAL